MNHINSQEFKMMKGGNIMEKKEENQLLKEENKLLKKENQKIAQELKKIAKENNDELDILLQETKKLKNINKRQEKVINFIKETYGEGPGHRRGYRRGFEQDLNNLLREIEEESSE